MAAAPVRESIQEIDDNSWLIGGRLLLTRAQPSESTWRYKIMNASAPLPKSRALSDTSDVKLIHDVGDVSAVFTIGDTALCKVRIIDLPHATREHTTLSWLHEREWSFAIPKTLFHAEFDGRYYIVLDRVSGNTLDSVWITLEEARRQRLSSASSVYVQSWQCPLRELASAVWMIAFSRNDTFVGESLIVALRTFGRAAWS